jgi:hypothetical protein
MNDRHRHETDRTLTVQLNDDGITATARFGDEVKTVPIHNDENGKFYVSVTFEAGTFSTKEEPMGIRDFVTTQLDAEDPVCDGYGEYWPCHVNSDRLVHDLQAKRSVLARHANDPTSKYDKLACLGCPTNETDGGYTVEDIDDCPELQDLAWRWHTAEGWNMKWCPHYESYLVKETPDPKCGPFSLKFCTHCGAILGRVYEIDVLQRAALEALGLDPNRGILGLRMGAERIDLELTGGLDVTIEVADLTPEQRAAFEAYAFHPGAAR